MSDGLIKRSLNIADAHLKVSANPFVAYEDFGQRLRITTLMPAAEWFLKQECKEYIEKNPTLAFFLEGMDSTGISYDAVRRLNPPYEDTKAFLDAKISRLIAEDEKLTGCA